ncbi:cytochrome P450 [Cubamyces lactineus]|nr:cytochrome P450 [Cubamyces lactineus]
MTNTTTLHLLSNTQPASGWEFNGLPPIWMTWGVAFILCIWSLFSRNQQVSHPPGPTGLPIIGNVHQMTHDAWNKFTEWKAVYGPIVHLRFFRQNVVVLNTLQSAADLLDKRAAKYSSRPRFVVACQMLTEGYFFVFQGYSDLWRRMRRAAHESLHKGAVHQFHSIQTIEATMLLQDLHLSPENWEKHLQRTSASTLLSACYGTSPLKSIEDPEVELLNTFTRKIVRAGYVDAYAVECMPFLRHIPTWLAPWKRDALEWAPRFTKLFENFYTQARDRAINEDRTETISAMISENEKKYNLTSEETAWLVGTIASGYETISGTMSWWALAMVLNPDAQKTAQAEIDTVVGRDRLPTMDDVDKLVYVQAMLKEILRWHPVGPLGMQHTSSEDDHYEGYFIPKGTICIANVWAINRDPDIWGLDADKFNPARYLQLDDTLYAAMADTKDEGHVTYGFGRRICVGRHLARDTLLLNMASILWMFDIKPPLDSSGTPVECVEDSVDHGLVVRPQEYQHRFVPRNPEVVDILQSHRELLGI